MLSGQVHNKKSLEQLRKKLRNLSTSAEAALWAMLKKSQIEGRKFRRQHSVGPYILDFYCPSEKLAVELDGAHHFTEQGLAYDEERSAYLARYNIRVIRFENREVFENPEAVLEKIKNQFNHARSASAERFPP
jgi:very-short-patch-repair endonuclease